MMLVLFLVLPLDIGKWGDQDFASGGPPKKYLFGKFSNSPQSAWDKSVLAVPSSLGTPVSVFLLWGFSIPL